MLEPRKFIEHLINKGITKFIGVPCSYISGVYTILENEFAEYYISCTSEGEATAVAAGVWLGGGMACVFTQNSGLGNMVNPISSLTAPYQIPVIVVVSRRGWPEGTDEPQHEIMGKTTVKMLELLGSPTQELSKDSGKMLDQIDWALDRVHRRQSPALIVNKGTFANIDFCSVEHSTVRSDSLAKHSSISILTKGTIPTRKEAINEYLNAELPHRVIGSTGYNSRTLYMLDNSNNHFFMAGSMGCASSIALGISVASGAPVSIIDGDGSLLMKLGSMVTNTKYAKQGFLHLLLDNQCHESTGAQQSNSGQVDFVQAASACGYESIYHCTGIDALKEALILASNAEGTVFIYCKTKTSIDKDLARLKISFPTISDSFREKTIEWGVSNGNLL